MTISLPGAHVTHTRHRWVLHSGLQGTRRRCRAACALSRLEAGALAPARASEPAPQRAGARAPSPRRGGRRAARAGPGNTRGAAALLRQRGRCLYTAGAAAACARAARPRRRGGNAQLPQTPVLGAFAPRPFRCGLFPLARDFWSGRLGHKDISDTWEIPSPAERDKVRTETGALRVRAFVYQKVRVSSFPNFKAKACNHNLCWRSVHSLGVTTGAAHLLVLTAEYNVKFPHAVNTSVDTVSLIQPFLLYCSHCLRTAKQ